MRLITGIACSILLLCSTAHGVEKWDYLAFYNLNARVAESINGLTSFDAYEKLRQRIKNPKDQDLLQKLYVKMKSHPLKAFPLFDRLVLTDNQSIHTVRIHSFKPFMLSVDRSSPIEIDPRNVNRASSKKTAAFFNFPYFEDRALAESRTYSATDFRNLYALVTESFGQPVFEDRQLETGTDRKLKNDAQKVELADGIAKFMNHFKVSQFACPNSDAVNKILYNSSTDEKMMFVLSAQDGKKFAGSCTKENLCKYFPLEYDQYQKKYRRDFLVADTTNARDLAIKALREKNVLQKVDKDQLSIDCNAKGLGKGFRHAFNPKKLEKDDIAKQDECYLSHSGLAIGDHAVETAKLLEMSDNELISLAKKTNNTALTAELEKILSIRRQEPMTSDNYILPELTKNGAVAALVTCCRDSECRQEFTQNGQGLFTEAEPSSEAGSAAPGPGTGGRGKGRPARM